jgi:hypothetical protein
VNVLVRFWCQSFVNLTDSALTVVNPWMGSSL